MKIAVNVRLLLTDKLDGMEWFTYETLKRITKNHPEHEFIFIFDRPYSKEFIFSNNIKPIVVPPKTNHPILCRIWFNWCMPFIIKKHKPDLFLSTDGWIPLKTKIPIVNILHQPKSIGSESIRKSFRKFAKKSKRIITISEYTKNNIASYYNVPLNKIDIAYNGSKECYKPITEKEKQETLSTFTNGNSYFIYVDTILQHKKTAILLDAFDAFKNTHNNNIKLVVVNSKNLGNSYNKMVWKKDVIFINNLNSEVLNKALASSIALVSFSESFDFPIANAFNAETAVIGADTELLTEVAADAALYFNSNSTSSIADTLYRISSDDELRNSLIEKGKIRRLDFLWDKTAEKVWTSIEKATTMNNYFG